MLLFVIILIAAIHPLTMDMYAPAFPLIKSQFHTSVSLVQISMTSFLAGLIVFQIFSGALSDKYGRKKVLLAGLSSYIVSSFACSLSFNIVSLIIFRFLQAVGAGTTSVLSRAIVKDSYEKKDVARNISRVSAVASIFILLSPLIGGNVTSAFGWRFVFGLQVLLGAVALLLVMVFVQDRKPAGGNNLRITTLFRDMLFFSRQKKVLTYLIPNAASMSTGYCFMAAGSLILISFYHVNIKHYGLFYGIALAGYVTGNTISALKSKQLGSDVMIRFGTIISFLAGTTMLAGVILSIDSGVYIITTAMFFISIGTGLVLPGTAAQSMLLYPERAGSMASLVQTSKMALALIVIFILSLFNTHSPMPFIAIIFMLSLISFASFRVLKNAVGKQAVESHEAMKGAN